MFHQWGSQEFVGIKTLRSSILLDLNSVLAESWLISPGPVCSGLVQSGRISIGSCSYVAVKSKRMSEREWNDYWSSLKAGLITINQRSDGRTFAA